MTENEAIKSINDKYETFFALSTTNDFDMAMATAIKALEEIQQYRAIGLTPELIEAMQGHNVALINDLGEYQLIGTVEEFKAYKLGDCMNDCEHYDNCSNYIYSKGYNKAIDDFAKRICDFGVYDHWGNTIDILAIAEDLKGEKQ